MKLILFDVDGTLAESTLSISQQMIDILTVFKEDPYYELGIVGGGEYSKIISQIGQENAHLFKYIFSENGLVSYKGAELFHKNDIKNSISENILQKIINFVLRYIADLELPYKRGSFVRFRTGMLYITPIGGDCSQEERNNFVEYDKIHDVRQTMIDALKKEFPDISILLGGAIGLGIHPKGWDKSYIMQFINKEDYDSIMFYGDRCTPDGNDYPLYSHPDIKGVCVKNPQDTIDRLLKIMN